LNQEPLPQIHLIRDTDLSVFAYEIHIFAGDFLRECEFNMRSLATNTGADSIAIMGKNHMWLSDALFTLRQYEEFARLQNGVLAQFTIQREILFAGQPFQAPESYLRNAELYEEGQTGNYNMLDGRLNNEPPVRPDLTDGQTDEEIRELVPEAKPSLMDRLKADKPEHEARQMIPPVPERER